VRSGAARCGPVRVRPVRSSGRTDACSYNVPVRRDLVLLSLIVAAAFGIRTYPAWNSVFTERGVNFLETDAWYHVRLVEYQVRNYPWRVTADPYAAPGGQFVPIAPLFDTITATVVVVMHGRDATTADIERIAAMMPPIFGALAVIVAWALARILFGRRAGLLAACLLTVLPGHFLDRTMVGFVDHHALEALLALTTLLGFARALTTPSQAMPFVAGAALGLYLLAWGSGAFLVAILGVWLVLALAVASSDEDRAKAAGVTAQAAVTALVLVVAFQDPAMHRYGTQLLGLGGLAGIAFAAQLVRAGRRREVFATLAVTAAAAAVAIVILAPNLIPQLLVDVARLAPDPTRMGVLEARPLFLYSGQWRWEQPWLFFRTGFFIGAIALVPFAVRVWRRRNAADILILIYAAAMFAATIGQNRFGYYLVTACALLGGWLGTTILDWGGVPHADDPAPIPWSRQPFARELAVIAVAGGMFAPNLAPRVLLAERTTTVPAHWHTTMNWLREHTAPPFLNSAGMGDDYYYARYPRDNVPSPDYTVMNWWDQGYWIVQRARRVPVANPTQGRAANSARFYLETDERRALEVLRAEHAGYVLSDWELPFRRLDDGTIMGRFQNIVDWAGGVHANYYEVVYRRESNSWTPVWVFYEPYYRSMAYRLSVVGGRHATPVEATTVITLASRVDTNGLRFRELVSEHTYESYDAAREAQSSASDAVIVGLNPWVSAFPLPPLATMQQVFEARTEEQQPTEAPWVRVFQVR
jgi:oligosaccharyl transferase (archaeosortase A-associated)